MNDALAELICSSAAFPRLSRSTRQILLLAHGDHANLDDIANAVTRHPSLAARLCHAAGYRAGSRRHPQRQLRRSLLKLGLRNVRMLCIAATLVDALHAAPQPDRIGRDFWRRSLIAAVAARQLATLTASLPEDEAFAAALLMDSGMIVFDRVLGPQYQQMIVNAQTHPHLAAIERAEMRLTHADLGAMVASQWPISQTAIAAIREHADPQPADGSACGHLVLLLQTAGLCADVFMDADPVPALAALAEQCRTALGLDSRTVTRLLQDVEHMTPQLADQLAIAGFESIRNTQPQFLRQQHPSNEMQMIYDSLTGLHSRTSFETLLRREVSAAAQNGDPISLLMIDIDHLQQTNDTFGHPIGDRVLTAVGKTVATARRSKDIAARCGGDRLTMLLPGTSHLRAVAIAECIRREIERMTATATSQGEVKVTVSIGIATLGDAQSLANQDLLLHAADQALHQAKQDGRNCVRVQVMDSHANAAAPANGSERTWVSHPADLVSHECKTFPHSLHGRAPLDPTIIYRKAV